MVTKTISDEKIKYAIPVYNIENISLIPDEQLQLNISDTQFFEMIILSIRGNTIKFASKEKNK